MSTFLFRANRKPDGNDDFMSSFEMIDIPCKFNRLDCKFKLASKIISNLSEVILFDDIDKIKFNTNL